MTSTSSDPNPEFRRYRSFLAWTAVLLVSAGTAWILVSVAFTLYRRTHAEITGPRVGAVLSEEDFRSCLGELSDVSVALEKHLENFHTLLAEYDKDAAQTWADEGGLWRRRWKALAVHCRFDGPPAPELPRELRRNLDQMKVVHEDMGATEASYTRELLRFHKEQAPRLGDIRARLDKIARRSPTDEATGGRAEALPEIPTDSPNPNHPPEPP